MAKATDIKKKIKDLLDELVREQTLGEVHYDDLKLSIFDRDYGKYPAAILTTPSIEARTETNRDNLRTYTFEVVVVHKAEDIGGDLEAIEDLAEKILKKFDDDMLTGTASKLRTGGADGGVEPSTSTPEAVVSRSKTFIVFSVFIRAHALYTS